jgi:hypothetical protein
MLVLSHFALSLDATAENRMPSVTGQDLPCRRHARIIRWYGSKYEANMAIPIVALPEGTRVRIVRGAFPQPPHLTGRLGTVVAASEYQPQSVSVVLDGEAAPRVFAPAELEVQSEPARLPEREAAKRRPALP